MPSTYDYLHALTEMHILRTSAFNCKIIVYTVF